MNAEHHDCTRSPGRGHAEYRNRGSIDGKPDTNSDAETEEEALFRLGHKRRAAISSSVLFFMIPQR